MLRPIRRALFSVSDKTGLVDFARELHTKYGVELIATGGTRKALADAGLPVKDVSELTGFPEILDGRVKTLHPAIYAGLLAKRDKPEHMTTLAEHKLPEIDLVVCNLYPFEQTVAKPGVTEAEAIENIDIGGPCMIRAAAKNFASVAVLTRNDEYTPLLSELRASNGSTSEPFRHWLAALAFLRI
ncbi:MAG TPA: bifunctional phosphoribosylaminoimidazolecarboxamide formyltransferase/IMP cyclohydrolase, partial [Fimbriiglobus sp.]|nr:bifunctional phosphoribosylaminoimidazolecarboxamide formyltransferase/IMP cyclohydrolase [Fimbriiglobus sp.]